MRFSGWLLVALVPAALACNEDEIGGIGDDGDRYTASLTGANVRPTPVTSAAVGTATFVVRQPSIGSTQRTVGYSINVNLLTDVREAHLHLGGASVSAGQILATLYTNPRDTATVPGRLASGTLGVGPATLAISLDSLGTLLRSGAAYVDVHTESDPGGALRGQVVRPGQQPPGEMFAASTMTGAAQRPTPNPSAVTGTATFEVLNGNSIRYSIRVNSMSEITAAHIHGGTPNVAGPIFVTLLSRTTPSGPLTGSIAEGTITSAGIQAALTVEGLLTLMRGGQLYVDVHSSRYQDGEIRGQILPVSALP